MNEFELKFQVPAEHAAAVEQALKRGEVSRQHLRARYFDTPAGDLETAGIALRLRREGRGWVQTVKGPGRGGFDRLEHNAAIGTGGAEPQPDLARHDGHPLRAMLDDALGRSAARLQPVFETDIHRLTREIAVAGSTIELALDRGEIRANAAAYPVMELELELKEGSASAVFELARSWRQAHGLWLDPVTKADLGRRLAHRIEQPPAVIADQVRESGRQLQAAVLESGLRQVLWNARELVAGQGGDEHVHQLRVGLRRLRSALRELDVAGLAEDQLAQIDSALRALFSVLGEHRDQSTLLPAILRELADAGHPVQAWAPALPDLATAIREPGVQDAFLGLAELAQALREGEGERPKTLRAQARERLRRLHRKTLKSGQDFDELPVEERHRVRKRLKRLRYLAELVRSLFAGSAVDAYVQSLKELQDALGRYQDATAGRALFERRAASDPAAWFGAGWLAAREAALAAECARACRRTARKAKPFWD
ncbi:CYTH and CHAD domain-containing protein [Ramlibacter solisilvae]|uniref:CHAD domain-containing protein n=1 Tax=Ramlibacter tataouinensis TaxID=94132 RepID=A0A127JYF7_9BURK|nr:CYTH and CHAD domain-containing protein [Ramlibacter tataouinensis]AMO25016.1 hypothetical protein UC35_22035 [Ramlibacter tataouinensis]